MHPTLEIRRSALDSALGWLASLAPARAGPPRGEARLLVLHRAALHRIAAPAQSLITCIEGCLWVTQDGMPDDHVLKPGECLLVRTPQRVIVQALDPSRCRITPLRGARAA